MFHILSYIHNYMYVYTIPNDWSNFIYINEVLKHSTSALYILYIVYIPFYIHMHQGLKTAARTSQLASAIL